MVWSYEAGQEPTPTGTSTLIGVAICVAGNTCISLALNVQKLAHTRLEKRRSRTKTTSSTTSTNPKSTPSYSNEQTPLLSPLPSPSLLLSSPSSRPTLEQSISDPELNLQAAPTNLHLIPVRTSSSNKLKRTRTDQSAKSQSQSQSQPKSKTNEDSEEASPRTDKAFLKSPLWLLGFGLLNLGEFGNFLSYSFAPASLVAPLGSVALVANVGLAPVICGEPFRKRDLFGCALAALGAVIIVWASKSQDKKLYPPELLSAIASPLFIIYSILSCIFILILIFFSRTKYGDGYVMIDLGICALSGAFTVLSTKAISSFLSLIFLKTFRYWISYPLLIVLAGSAMLQINFINKALQRFESRIVIPCQFMSFALSTIIGSAVLYREFDGVTLASFLNFVFGCITCGAGVYLLTRNPTSSPTSSNSKKPNPTSSNSTTSNEPHDSNPNAHGLLLPSNANLNTTSLLSPSTSIRARKLSLTLGGTQYLLAHSPSKTSYFGSVSSKNYGAPNIVVNDAGENGDVSGDVGAMSGEGRGGRRRRSLGEDLESGSLGEEEEEGREHD